MASWGSRPENKLVSNKETCDSREASALLGVDLSTFARLVECGTVWRVAGTRSNPRFSLPTLTACLEDGRFLKELRSARSNFDPLKVAPTADELLTELQTINV